MAVPSYASRIPIRNQQLNRIRILTIADPQPWFTEFFIRIQLLK
jgi:hypothetical protein